MTDKDLKNEVPSKDEDKTSKKPPVATSTENGEQKETGKAPLEVPDKLKGKTAEELVQQYLNLEKKLGEQSTEVSEVRETKKNIEILLGAIYADPKRYQEASTWIKDYLSGNMAPSRGDEEAKAGVSSNSDVRSDDTRRALQNQILTDFYRKHGIDQLEETDRKSEQSKIATAFAEVADPGGKKPVTQLLNEIPLDRLPKFLETAYLMANADKIRQQGFLTAEENRQASIGSLSSSSRTEEEFTLSPEEQAVARKLGINPDDYIKQKKTLLRGR